MTKIIKVGTTITKEEYKKDGGSFYMQCAIWCDTNNAQIEDRGTYYEIVEKKPYIPTVEQQIEQLEQQIEEINKTVLRDIIILLDENGTQEKKEEAKGYFNQKQIQRKILIDKIKELKNK